MKSKEIRSTDRNTLNEKVIELKGELLKMNAQIAIGSALSNSGQVRKVKKTIARILTIEHEKKETADLKPKSKPEVDKKE